MIKNLVDIEINDIKIKGEVYFVNASKEKGFNIGYTLFVPENCNTNTTLILGACNSSYTNSFSLEEALEVAKDSTCELNLSMWLASDMNMPLLTPHVPRIYGFFAQTLNSYTYLNDVSLISVAQSFDEDNRIREQEILEVKEVCKNLPLQVANIIDDVKILLQSINIKTEDKIIIEGYSTGSKFANLFSALYPERIKVLISGGGTGLGILPIKNYKGIELNFPLGISNIPNFNYEEFKKINHLYYIGSEDINDPALYEIKYKVADGKRIDILDDNGKTIPLLENGKYVARYSDNYTDEEVDIINRLFGNDVQKRFGHQEKVYRELLINAVFKKFDGDHYTLTSYKKNDEVNEYKKEFIKKCCNIK